MGYDYEVCAGAECYEFVNIHGALCEKCQKDQRHMMERMLPYNPGKDRSAQIQKDAQKKRERIEKLIDRAYERNR